MNYGHKICFTFSLICDTVRTKKRDDDMDKNERLEAFEKMLSDIQKQLDYESRKWKS